MHHPSQISFSWTTLFRPTCAFMAVFPQTIHIGTILFFWAWPLSPTDRLLCNYVHHTCSSQKRPGTAGIESCMHGSSPLSFSCPPVNVGENKLSRPGASYRQPGPFETKTCHLIFQGFSGQFRWSGNLGDVPFLIPSLSSCLCMPFYTSYFTDCAYTNSTNEQQYECSLSSGRT